MMMMMLFIVEVSYPGCQSFLFNPYLFQFYFVIIL